MLHKSGAIMEAPSIPDVVSCLLTRDSATDRWLGHCLDFDLVTSGKNPDSAWENLRSIIKFHVEHCFTHHSDGLRFRAPREDWELFEALKAKQKLIRTEKITLTLVRNEFEALPLWVQGVESLLGGSLEPTTDCNHVSPVH